MGSSMRGWWGAEGVGAGMKAAPSSRSLWPNKCCYLGTSEMHERSIFSQTPRLCFSIPGEGHWMKDFLGSLVAFVLGSAVPLLDSWSWWLSLYSPGSLPPSLFVSRLHQLPLWLPSSSLLLLPSSLLLWAELYLLQNSHAAVLNPSTSDSDCIWR